MPYKNNKKEEDFLESHLAEEIKKENTSSKKRDYFLPISILIAGVLIAGSLIYSTGKKAVIQEQNSKPSAQLPQPSLNEPSVVENSKVEIGDAVILGDAKAPVTLIEYGDYQCPFCASFFKETEPLLIKNYVEKGKVKMAYKNFAFLDQFPGGKNESHLAAEAAACAADQNKFWEYHDLIFKTELEDEKATQGKSENNGNLTVKKLESLATELGLNQDQFNSCLEKGKYKEKVQKETDEAQSLGVRATPTFFINGQKFEGALPYSQFQAAIDKLLK